MLKLNTWRHTGQQGGTDGQLKVILIFSKMFIAFNLKTRQTNIVIISSKEKLGQNCFLEVKTDGEK